MNTYKITFIDQEDSLEPVDFTFTEDDINMFNISFNSVFSADNKFYSTNIKQEDIKVQILIGFICNNNNFIRIGDLLTLINYFNKIKEIIIYRNGDLLCDLKNVIDVSSISNLIDNGALTGITINIIEGV